MFGIEDVRVKRDRGLADGSGSLFGAGYAERERNERECEKQAEANLRR